MLRNLAFSEISSSFWATVGATAITFVLFLFVGFLFPSLHLLSGAVLALLTGIIGGLFFLGTAIMTAWPLLRAHTIITAEKLPKAFCPEFARSEQPWRKRTSVRYIEALKSELTASEDRLELVATIEAYIRYYNERATGSNSSRSIIWALEKSDTFVTSRYSGDAQLVADLIERIDSLYAGDVAAEIRVIEERLDDLRYQRGQIAPQLTGQLRTMDVTIRMFERDVIEIKNWQALQQGTVAESSPQRQRFDHAKTVEYDNERIQIWARYAKFKAYEEQLAMKKEEMEKIEKRVARGELTKSDAAYLLQKLDEYFGDHDDRIFA